MKIKSCGLVLLLLIIVSLLGNCTASRVVTMEELNLQFARYATLKVEATHYLISYGVDQSTWPEEKIPEYAQLLARVSTERNAYNDLCARYLQQPGTHANPCSYIEEPGGGQQG